MKYLMLTYAFDTLGFSRVEFRADSRNAQSRTAMEQIGVTFEGELRSNVVKQDGYRSNSVIYSILKNEWPSIKTARFAAALETVQ
jgi:RimJ/RimL family protein N-acetyltransferase